MMPEVNWLAVKALLFDFDGVIVESVDIKTRAYAKLYEEHGEEVVKKVISHHLLHGGISRFEKIRFYHKSYLGREIDAKELDLWCKRFSDIVLENVVKAPLVPGVLGFLKKMSGKFFCFIVSGTPQEELELILVRKSLSQYFKKAYGSPSSKQTIIENIMYLNQLNPHEIMYYGDSMSDYDAAISTGVYFTGRVPKGTQNPFPRDTHTIDNFTEHRNVSDTAKR